MRSDHSKTRQILKLLISWASQSPKARMIVRAAPNPNQHLPPPLAANSRHQVSRSTTLRPAASPGSLDAIDREATALCWPASQGCVVSGSQVQSPVLTTVASSVARLRSSTGSGAPATAE
jgi:hypothetical protein